MVSASVFSVTITCMFAASALFHRVQWTDRGRCRMRRADHTAIYLVIAGGYTAYGLIVLAGSWRIAVLATVWTAVVVAIALRIAWVNGPGWVTAVNGVTLGWISLVILPKVVEDVGIGGLLLLLAGGIFYTSGALVYAWRRPNPSPTVFGYHEVFHTLVIAGVLCHYLSVAFFLLPGS